MLRYYLRLALNSFARTPGLTALMACAIALGIAACVITLTLHRAMSANPIAAKNDRLFAVTMDAWDPSHPADEDQPELPPPQLTYSDATHLLTSDIPARKVIMYAVAGVIVGGASDHRPVRTRTRVTTADFFSMFDVPFQYGSGWRSAADNGPAPVIVLSHSMNEKLFGGANSVGRTVRWNDRDFRIVGVLAEWLPMPRSYDLNGVRAQPGQRDRLMRTVEQHLSESNLTRVIEEIRPLQYHKDRGYQRDRNLGIILLSVTIVLLMITALGIFVGVPLALAGGYWLSHEFGVPRLNAYFLAGTMVALAVIGQLAAWQPARRAAAVSPAVATRTI